MVCAHGKQYIELTITMSLRILLKGFPSRTIDFSCGSVPSTYGKLLKENRSEEGSGLLKETFSCQTLKRKFACETRPSKPNNTQPTHVISVHLETLLLVRSSRSRACSSTISSGMVEILLSLMSRTDMLGRFSRCAALTSLILLLPTCNSCNR